MTANQLRYQIMLFMAESGVTFNSGFAEEIELERSGEKKQKTLIHTWFLPPQSRHPLGYRTRVGKWKLSKEAEKEKILELREFGARENPSELSLFLPKTLEKHWQQMVSLFGEPSLEYDALLTPGGRSFWVFNEEQQECFGLKFETLGQDDENKLYKKSLDADMIYNTIEMSEFLNQDNAAVWESYGLSASLKNSEKTILAHVVRRFKWEQIDCEEGDVFLPISVLMSHGFWQRSELTTALQLPQMANIREWFVEQIAPGFAEMITKSVFKTGISVEAHQQNLTVHLRSGQVKNIFFHDLQDCLLDPVTKFLCDDAPFENTGSLEVFEVERQLALPGELLLEKSREKLSVSVADWWRRWLRVFGQYDRTLNILSGADPFAQTLFEDKINKQFKKNCRERGFAVDETTDLYQQITQTQIAFQQEQIKKHFADSTNEVTTTDLLEIFKSPRVIASVRAPWTQEMLLAWLEKEKNAQKQCWPAKNKKLFLLKGEDSCHLYCVLK